MSHPFQDKLFVFIGRPERCSSREAYDALYAVGGVTDDRISTFTDYAVEFRHNGNSAKFAKALEYNHDGFLVLLDEAMFFNIIDGKTVPPEKNKPRYTAIPNPYRDTDTQYNEFDDVHQIVVNEKRLNYMAKHGVPTPDGGRVKADLRALYKMRRVLDFMKESPDVVSDIIDRHNCCDECGAPAKVFIGDGENGTVAKMCLDCHNRLMAEIIGIEMPDFVPKRLSFKDSKRKIREFDIEFYIFEGGKTLTATEDGKTKLKADVFGELEDDFSDMLRKLTRKIEKALTTKYIRPDGSFEGSKAVGYIDWNHERDACDIVIDGQSFTWAQLEKNISSHEGWKIKIEFGDIGDDFNDEE